MLDARWCLHTYTHTCTRMCSWHAAVVLPIDGRRLVLVHGGYDGAKALSDSFVLDMGVFYFVVDMDAFYFVVAPP